MKPLLSWVPHRLLVPSAFALFLAMNTNAAGDHMLVNFQTATNTAGWQVVNDDVMGGVSASRFRLTNGVALFQGRVSLENNGGFASVRSLPARHELAGCDAFVVRVRGDGRSYKFTARTDPGFDGPVYQYAFPTKKGEWEEHRLPFNRFTATFRGRALPGEPPLDGARISSFGFLISDQQEGPFQLEVAWIKAARPTGQ